MDYYCDLEREKKVLHSFINDENSTKHCNEVDSAVFSGILNIHLADVIKDIFEKNNKLNKTLVEDNIKLSAAGDHIKTQIINFLNDTSIEKSINIEDDIKYLKTLYNRRIVYEKLYKGAEDIKSGKCEYTQVINRIIDLPSKIITTQKEETIQELSIKIKDKIFHPKKDDKGLLTGINTLDNCYMGIKKDKIITIGAESRTGKTALCVDIIHRLCSKYNNQIAICFFSFEMSKLDILSRLVSRISGFREHDFDAYNFNKLNTHDKSVIEKSINIVSEYSITIYDKLLDNSNLKFTINQFANKNKDKHIIFFLDHLGMIQQNNNDRRIHTIDACLIIKEACRKHNATFFPLTQLVKNKSNSNYYKPNMSQIIESGFVESISDSVILIWRPEMYGYKKIEIDTEIFNVEKKAFLLVNKNRHGNSEDIYLDCDIATNKFGEDNQVKYC